MFFRSNSLHCINCVATRNLTIFRSLFLEEFAVSHLNMTGFSDVVHRSHTNEPKIVCNEIFSDFLKLNLADFL